MTTSGFRLFFLLVVSCVACNAPKNEIPPPAEGKAVEKVVVYQMLVRLFGNSTSVNKPFGSKEENGVGKFNDITLKALQSLRDMGVTHVWYTGVLEHATMTDYSRMGIAKDDPDVVKGRAGSPYAIKDYYDVDPDLAVRVSNRMQEFEALIERTHSSGLKVIIDFVPNHVARSYASDRKPEGVRDLGEDDDRRVSFKTSNNFYYLPGESFRVPVEVKQTIDAYPGKDGRYDENPAKVTGNDQFTASPGIHEWFETVKLNYAVDVQQDRKKYFDPIPDTWEKMRDILVFWANKKVDGFRCDMAEMVPIEFWNWVIPQIKRVNRDLLFIAEVYSPEDYKNFIVDGRFDYLYEKVMLYDTLRLMIDKKRKTTDIAAIQNRLTGLTPRLLHFLENHDEQRVASPFFAGDPWRAVPAMTISATLDEGAVMIYAGQEMGEPGRGAEGFSGDDGRTTIFDYWSVPELQKWVHGGRFSDSLLTDSQKRLRNYYSTLLNLAKQNQALTRGAYADLTEFNIAARNVDHQVHVFVRHHGNERLLIVNSFNDRPAPVRIALTPEIARAWQLDNSKEYTLRDLLGGEVVAMKRASVEITLKPYSSFIFKLQ